MYMCGTGALDRGTFLKADIDGKELMREID